MQAVTVEKDWLYETVAANRETHRDQFEKAFEGYRRECIKMLEENLAKFKAGSCTRLIWHESPPEDHTSDYDRVMAMLVASVDDTIELQSHEFACYVQDDWGWKESWSASNTKYMT